MLTSNDAKGHYAALLEDQDNINQYFKGQIEWNLNPGANQSRLRLRRENVEFSMRNQWPDLIEWLIVRLERLDTFFRPIVKTLEPAPTAIVGEMNDEDD